MATSSDPPQPPKAPPPFYTPKLTTLNPRMQELLRKYGIPATEALQHVQDVRDRAWAAIQYPCIGDFLFTDFEMPRHGSYTKVLTRLRNPDRPQRLLDLGCGFGQELRNLAALGVPEECLIGLDNSPEMIGFGHDLFKDADTCKSRFVVADMLDLSTFPKDLLGTIDIVFAGLSFHLFDWERQVEACANAAAVLKSEGSMIFGWQLGRTESKIVRVSRGHLFVHDVQTFEKLWMEVGKKMGKSFRVEARLDEITKDSNMGKMDADFRVLRFEVGLVVPSTAL